MGQRVEWSGREGDGGWGEAAGTPLRLAEERASAQLSIGSRLELMTACWEIGNLNDDV